MAETAQKEYDKHNNLRIVSVRIWTRDIPNKKQCCQPLTG